MEVDDLTVKEIFMKENNLRFKVAMTAWVLVSILMTLGFILNIVFAIR